MNYFKTGDRVQISKDSIAFSSFKSPTAVVVGYATLQSGVPCLILSMDEKVDGVPYLFTDRLVVPMCFVEPL